MKKFDIVILAGQSNAEGGGIGTVDHEFEPSPLIWSLDAEKTVEHLPNRLNITYYDRPFVLEMAMERTYNGEKVGDLALRFLERYSRERLAPDRKVLLLRCAIGGSGFIRHEWTTDGPIYRKMLEMVDYALSLNPENRLVAMLWHQGECDSWEETPPDIFYAEFKEMIDSLKARYDVPNMPVIAGDFVAQWRNRHRDMTDPIVQKIRQVLMEVGSSAFVETDDLQSNDQKTGNGDDLHFCREALYTLGERYFDAFERIQFREKHTDQVACQMH